MNNKKLYMKIGFSIIIHETGSRGGPCTSLPSERGPIER